MKTSHISPLNRTAVNTGVKPPVRMIQFGEGNFLRAFVDWMVDILNEKTDFNGSVTIVQPLPQGLIGMLNEQDGLYHVLLQGIKDGEPYTSTRLITCINDAINPYDDYAKFLKLGENPGLNFICSNTTESGIAFDESDTSYSVLPSSFPGKLTALLLHRFKFFDGASDKAPAIIPCELIDRNGDNLREMVIRYAEFWKTGPEFSTWLSEDVVFCNTLVDRIVPGYPREKASEIQHEMGYKDNLIVTGEYFHLWVIEAPERIREKLPFSSAGLNVTFTDDLSPYRTRKVRILNGVHTSMVPVAYLYGNRTVRESMENADTGDFIRRLLFEEILPTLHLPEEELSRFANDVLDRFRNPYIRHELSSIALNSVSKFKVRVLPSLTEFYSLRKQLPDRLVFALASLILFYRGEWDGEKMPVNDSDDVISFMNQAWNADDTLHTAQTVLGNESFWDTDLNAIPGLTVKVSEYLGQIEKNGMRETIKNL
jgi:tagaturonate reductase